MNSISKISQILIFVCTVLQVQAVETFPEKNSVCSSDSGQCSTPNIFRIFKCLDSAYEIAQSIKDKEERGAVCNPMKRFINQFRFDLMKKDYAKIKDDAECFYENLGEILAECSEADVRDRISECFSEMMDRLETIHPEA